MKLRKNIKCVVCGAGIPADRYNTNTCSSLCRRARDGHRTRNDQALYDARIEYAERRFWGGSPSLDPDRINDQREDERQNLGYPYVD